jgi:hypothetical protein
METRYNQYIVKVTLVSGLTSKYQVTDINRVSASKQIADYLQKKRVAFEVIESELKNTVPIIPPKKT